MAFAFGFVREVLISVRSEKTKSNASSTRQQEMRLGGRVLELHVSVMCFDLHFPLQQAWLLRSEPRGASHLAPLPPMRKMPSNVAAAAAAVALPGTPSPPEKVARPAAVRRKQGKIDYDFHIARQKLKMKDLSRELKKTKADSRNEKRKKQRLVRKAAQLTIVDLHRIAALKKAGIWDPEQGLAEVPHAGADAAAASGDAEVMPPPPLADTGGACSDPVRSAEVDPVAKGASSATPVAVAMSVDAADDDTDVEEDAPRG